MLYGHVETMEERVEHLLRLRAQQDQSGGFLTFIPLAYQVGTTRLVERQTPPTDDLRTIAASRLLLDNFAHIEAYWVMLGEATASIALHFGASDVNGTLEDEKIAHMALAASPAGLAREQILRMIRDAGKLRSSGTPSTTWSRCGTSPVLIGRIPYLNCEPFFAHLPAWPEVAMAPRALGRAVRSGAVDAAPLSLVDMLDLDGHIVPLSFGIAVRGPVQSVLLFSSRPP